jgi:hypothetical protein
MRWGAIIPNFSSRFKEGVKAILNSQKPMYTKFQIKILQMVQKKVPLVLECR